MKSFILVVTLTIAAFSLTAPVHAGSQIVRIKSPGAVSLNPQPIPPKESFSALNPQPIPPGGETSIIIVGGKGGAVSLNPQPIPPKEVFGGFRF